MRGDVANKSAFVLPYATRVRRSRGLALVCLFASFIPEITGGLNTALVQLDVRLPVPQQALNVFGFLVAPAMTIVFGCILRRRCTAVKPVQSSVIASAAIIVSSINLLLGVLLFIFDALVISPLYRLDI